MGQSKKVGMTGSQKVAVKSTNLSRYYYMYGRRLIMYSLVVLFAFFIGWFLHRQGYFAHLR